MEAINKASISFLAKSNNEGFARAVVAAFASQVDPTIEELTDLKTAVSEAVTNCIIHGYEGGTDNYIVIEAELYEGYITVYITDFGKGIEDIHKARMPMYTSCPEQERSGMGFTIMETFTDELEIESVVGEGTRVKMTKYFTKVT